MTADRALHVMRDVADGQLLSADGYRLGRVADIAAVYRPDGTLEVTALILGPAALARRISSGAGRLASRLQARRFERVVPIEEVLDFGTALRLRSNADRYDLADGDEWARGILRFIPGSGWAGRQPRPRRGQLPPLDGGRRIWIADLIGSPVRDSSGRSLGPLVELRTTRRSPFRVTTLLMGKTGWLDRLKAARIATVIGLHDEPDAVSWQQVAQIRRTGEIGLR